MKTLSKPLRSTVKKFKNAGDNEIYDLIVECYENRNMSYSEIAEMCKTYTNKIRRAHTKGGGTSRTRSEAQSIALASGRHEHPTKDKGHSQETRDRIGESMSEVWSELSDSDREYRQQIGRDVWEAMTDTEKENLHYLAGKGIREAAKNGSKLEAFLLEELKNASFHVEKHKKNLIPNEKLHLDLYIPKMLTAIEVDGPSHFLDIWGKDVLQKNQKADSQKDALLLGNGFCIIRIRQAKTPSEVRKRRILKELLSKLEEWKTYPSRKNRFYTIGDENG
jgi:very-short-patch-repair endonuclease